MDRKQYLLSQIAQGGKGLEIGASYNPIVPKSSGAQVEILDYATAADLREKYRGIDGVDIERIEDVDHVSDGRPMVEVIGKTAVYDYIIASHVIEHAPDLIGFLKDCEALLKPGGRLVLAVPDKRRCFDVFLPVSTVGQALQAHFEKRTRHPLGAVFDAMASNARSGDQFVWNRGAKLNLSVAPDLAEAWRRLAALRASDAYVDIHGWRFTPSSFRMLIRDLADIGMIRLKEFSFLPTEGHEFYVTLSDDGGGCPESRLTLAHRAAFEQTEIPVQADTTPAAANPEGPNVAARGNFGERASPANKDWGFLAHLSIYEFAAKQAAGKRCLDVGCGTGYGAAHLGPRAGSLVALERDPALVSDLRQTYSGIRFEICDLDKGRIEEPDAAFDLIFTSNVLEHVAYIDPVIAEFTRLLAPGGRAIIAIPPIPTIGALRENAKNVFHITNLPHVVWQSKLERYFTSVTRYRHWVTPEKNPKGYEIDRTRPALEDFVFEAMPGPDEIVATITAVYVCEGPRQVPLDPSHERPVPPDWKHLRVEAEGRQEIYVQLSKRLEDIERYWPGELAKLNHWIAQQRKGGVDAKTVLKGTVEHLRLLSGQKRKRPPKAKRRRSLPERAWRWFAKHTGLRRKRGS